MPFLRGALNAVSFYSAFVVAVLHLRASKNTNHGPSAALVARRHWPRTTATLAIAVAIPTLCQFFAPQILIALRRDASAIADGQWWRLGTALFVQDGGIAGSLANLVGLLLVGAVAEWILGGRWLALLFFFGGLCTEVVALRWQPIGAGNSIANVSVAAGLVVWSMVRRQTPTVIVPASTAIVAWAALVILRDIHGVAAVFGALLGAGLCWRAALNTSVTLNR